MKKSFLAAITLLSLTVFDLPAQIIKTRLDVVAGAGIPEYLHAGLRYQYNDFGQLGVYYGDDSNIHPAYITTITAEHLFHFGKNNYHSNRPVWYARTGYTYSEHTEAEMDRKFTYLLAAAGRDLPLNNHFGFNIDLGLLYQVREKQVFKSDPSEPQYILRRDLRPAVRIQGYFSF